MVRKYLGYCFILFMLLSCNEEKKALMEEVSAKSGIEFENNLQYTEEFNPYTYRNFFNGAGVALADINNDGLLDIYFTGNIVDNKLYINKGNWRFEDITEVAGVACSGVWSSGATFADINGDGLQDLYVCKSGKPGGENRHNELFINNGDLTFTEKAKEYGLDVTGLSTHAAFFDYDKDGDLDCYILTNSIRSVGAGYDLIKDQREIPDPAGGGNKFFENQNGKFVDVTIEQGIYSSNIGFGLGITLSDFNNDTWTDIYISNDFFERDYLYLNQKGSGFKESLETFFTSIAMGSMGADAADLDNDQNADLFVTEMLPSSIERRRTKAVFESWDKYQLNVDRGYFHQYPRNVLQRNTGDSLFLEIGRYSGVSATDWSWGALIFDLNNDGLKDIFVSNGIYKDLLDRDYLTYMANEQQVKKILQEKGSVIKELIDIMPSSAVSNQVYENKGEFSFHNTTEEWGIQRESFSNGSAYGDLDNDGDLDLVVSNVNMPSFVFKNTTDTTANRSLRIKLIGKDKNTTGIGAKIMAYNEEQVFMVENFPSRGFQSSVDPVVHLGLGNLDQVDSLKVIWERGGVNTLYKVMTNQLLTIEERNAVQNKNLLRNSKKLKKLLKKSTISIPFKHKENNFIDFDRDRLLPHMLHNLGPVVTSGDIDGDGTKELFVGAAKGYPGKVYSYDNNSATFKEYNSDFLKQDEISEDVDAVFFDCDGDQDLDLYVASGGRAFSTSSSALKDRLYINDGKGNFRKEERIPFIDYFSTGVVKTIDYDLDGDLDLFVAERYHPFYYGTKVRVFFLENDGKGYFTDATTDVIPDLTETYMITDADAVDYDLDGDPDLVLATEWGPVMVLNNNEGVFTDATSELHLSDYTGWWNAVEVVDIDIDGDLDIIAGNHGLNTFFKDTTRMYVHDFDGNGTLDYIFCESRNGSYYPVADRNELISQLPALKKKLLYFKDYAGMAVNDIFSENELNKAAVWDATVMASSVFVNENGKFSRKSLNPKLQYGPVYSIKSVDLLEEDKNVILFGGNQFLVKPQFGRYDALPFTVMRGEDNMDQYPLLTQIRDFEMIEIDNKKLIVIANNNDELVVYEKND